MKFSRIVALLLAAGICCSAWAKSPKKSEITHIFCPATYVYVRTMDGDVMLPRVLPEDRDAASRVEDQLTKWNRYVLVYEPQQADLTFVVRTGRLATMDGHVGAGHGPRMPGAAPAPDPTDASQGPEDPSQSPRTPGGIGPHTEVGGGGSVGPPDDLLAVYTKPGNVDTQAPIWQQTQKDGLADPDVPLFQQIRTAVDQACKDQPTDKPSTQPGKPK
ncbi:MAG TPA: hypothetical protein VJS11_14340 [Acidobacteriaceae bacterium]|nr:hypothetical protein [Acidobacteriaceae bacterium]